MRKDQLIAKKTRLFSDRKGLEKMRSKEGKPDFAARLEQLEQVLGFDFPETYRGFIDWLNGINSDALLISEMQEAYLPTIFPKYDGEVVHLLNMDQEVRKETAIIQSTTENRHLLAIGRILDSGKETATRLILDTEKQALFYWQGSTQKLSPYPIDLSGLMGDPLILKQLLEKENSLNVIFPNWYRMAAAQQQIRDSIEEYLIWPATAVCHLSDLQSYEDAFPETFRAVCLAEPEDSYNDDFLAFLLKEDDDFELQEEVYAISDYGDHVSKKYNSEDFIAAQ